MTRSCVHPAAERIHKTRPGYNILVYIEALISTPPSPGPYSKKTYRNNDQISPASFKSPNWHKVTGFSRRSGSKERQMLEVLAVKFHSLPITQAWTKCFISPKKEDQKRSKKSPKLLLLATSHHAPLPKIFLPWECN